MPSRSSGIKEIQLTVKTDTGLHSRPADLFVRTSKLYKSVITVRKDAKSADAKNIIKLILLNVANGDTMTVSAEGPDEDAAVQDLKTLVESNFALVNEKVRI
jgi:phosphotransferase system HPr (HPr) family protein